MTDRPTCATCKRSEQIENELERLQFAALDYLENPTQEKRKALIDVIYVDSVFSVKSDKPKTEDN